MGPGRTSTVHGCLVCQGGCGWPVTTTSTEKTAAYSDMVAEPWLNVRPGCNVRDRQCDDSAILCLDSGCVGTGRIVAGGPGDKRS